MKLKRVILSKLNSLCARTEALQNKISQEDHREVYEAVAKAKDSLLEALREAERVGIE